MKKGEAIKKWEEILEEINSKKSEIDNILGAARQINDQLTTVLNEANAKSDSISTTQTQSQEKKSTIDQLTIEINQKKKDAETETNEINENKSTIESVKNDIANLKIQLEALLKTNNEQSNKLSDMLQKAAAVSLFQSFDIRKVELKNSSRIWAILVGITTILLVAVAFYIISITRSDNFFSHIFFIKLAISFPIIYWLIFSTRQYLKNKRLEEEYAFKSTVSLSLEAYRDLLKKEASEPTKEEVIPLITEAVSKIFTSPSESISKHPLVEDRDLAEGILDKLTNLVTKIKG